MIILLSRAIRAPEFAFACSRTIETMPFSKKGTPMSSEFHSASQAETANDEHADQHIDRHEQLITILAASLALTIVAAIAVLMGMA
jgi:hypothetical protein